MKSILYLLLISLVSLNGYAAKINFSKNEIVYPLGKNEIIKFFDLLKDPANQKVVELKNENLNFQDIPQENSAIVSIGSDSYLLYLDNINNSGNKIYLLVYLHSGSGDYSGIKGAYSINNGKLESLNLDEIIIKNLFPRSDMSRFHSYLAKPFIVRIDGKLYLRFQNEHSDKNIFTYYWKDLEFKKIDI